jgi:DNA-binding transcriptional ArsR family regulator
MAKTTGDSLSMEVLETAASIMRAIGHPLRIRILEILEAEEEANVTALCAGTGAPQPSVSQQLARMRHAGVLATRREGNQVIYFVALPAVLGVLGCIRRLGSAGRTRG